MIRPEPAAYEYRWKIDGEWVNWRASDASQAHPALTSLEERRLYSEEYVASLESALATAEAGRDAVHNEAIEKAVEANRLAREEVIYSGQRNFIDGVRKGHDRADAAIRALKKGGEYL